jgi:hypothetical protein
VIDPSANGYAGIFGTAGSSTKWKWDYAMDHNTYAVALTHLTSSNQLFTADYKLYIGDSSGNELPAALGASTNTTWTWQGPATFAPFITSHPASPAVAPGSNVIFQVVAGGLPDPTYQWRKNGAEIAGAIAASYSIPSVQAADAGGYDVVVVNTSGSVTSQVAVLSVSLPVYSSPPSWMPMTMLNVSFNPNILALAVEDEASKLGAGVYPVLSVATNGTYDPAQPWSVLNGTAHSRRLGWDDPNRRDPNTATHVLNLIKATYGAGAGVWIELLARTPGLESYLAVGNYGTNSPLAYSGIFGTAGSSIRWQWDGQMDHNTYAVNLYDITAANQLFSATYKVYVGDSLGNEILNPDGSSASTIETWTWQGPTTPFLPALAIHRQIVVEWAGSVTNQVSEAAPTLDIAFALAAPTLPIQEAVAVEWPSPATNYVLESAQALDSSSWATVTNTPVVIGGKKIVLLDPSGPAQYFRLRLVN